MRGAEVGVISRDRSRPSGPRATSGEGVVDGRIVGKVVIALLVFPVGVHAIFTALNMLLGPMLPTLLALAESWSDLLHKGLIGAAFLVAVRGSFSVCRRLWPATMVKAS
jgi:hypothetical protein